MEQKKNIVMLNTELTDFMISILWLTVFVTNFNQKKIVCKSSLINVQSTDLKQRKIR